MAHYGLENLKELVEITKPFGNLDYFLQRDLGNVLPLPIMEVVQNFGDGEVIDGPPPPPSKKRKVSSSQGFRFGPQLPFGHPLDLGEIFSAPANFFCRNLKWESGASGHVRDDKGKAKLMHDSSFNNSGLLSHAAMRLSDLGFNLDSILGGGAVPNDVLKSAIMEALSELLPSGSLSRPAKGGGADSVDKKAVVQVLKLMEPGKDKSQVEVKEFGPSTSGSLSD